MGKHSSVSSTWLTVVTAHYFDRKIKTKTRKK